jgi:hypothetical protein
VLAAALCALLVSVLGLALVWRTPQGVFRDPVAQLMALRQYVAGQSPAFNTVVAPSPDDLSRDTHEWISWWPPGMGLLLLPLVSNGMRLATAVRALSMICYVLGSVGWALWFAEFRMPRPVLLALAAAMPLSHYATTPLFQYYTESFSWAFIPWVLMGALALARVWQQRADARFLFRSGLFGLLLGLLYWLKYSAVFVSGGVLAFLAFLAVCDRRKNREFRSLPLACVGVPCTAIILVLIAWNKFMGAPANSVAATAGWQFEWHNLADAVALFPLAMTDGESLIHWLFFKPGKAVIVDPAVITLVALPVGLVLFWLVWHRRDAEPSLWLARYVATVTAAGVCVVWTFSGAGSHETRHVAGAAIMLIPVAVQEFSYVRQRWLRQGLVAAGTVILVIPLLYGAVALGGKALRTRGQSTAPSGFYNSVWTAKDPVSVVRRLQMSASPDTLWYVCEGTVALDMPGRILLRWAALSDVAELARETYRSSVPMRVNLLLPPDFEQNGKGAVIRASFPQAQRWVASKVEGAEYTLWSTTLN